MRPKTPRQRRAAFFFAFAHARRLLLIEILEDHPDGITFEALSDRSGISQGSLSHHLNVLSNADLLTRTIQGPFSIYKLNAKALGDMALSLALPNAA